MRDYGKVFSTFWTSDTTRDLSDRGRILAVYLLTGPHTNMIGCFRLPDGYVCEDLRWEPETVSKGFEELFRNGFATRDLGSKWVYVTNYMKWNPIENPNQGKSAVRLFSQIPDSLSFKCNVANELAKQGDKIPASALKPFRNRCGTVSKPFRNQEQEQEQEQEQDLAAKPPRKGVRKPDPLFDAVAEVTGSDPKVSASHVARVRSLLADAEPPYSPEDVREFGRRFKQLCPYAAKEDRIPNLGEVEKYIGKLRATKPKAADPEGEQLRRQAMKTLAEAKAREQMPAAAGGDDEPF